jgi:hypothetical protein
MTPEDKRNSIIYQMRKNLADGVHTMDRCKCNRWKRGGTEACVCCLADMLRLVEHQIEIAKLTADLKQMNDLYQETL